MHLLFNPPFDIPKYFTMNQDGKDKSVEDDELDDW